MLRRSLLSLALVTLLSPTPAVEAQTAPTLEAITRNIDDLFRSEATIARMEVTIVTPRATRTMRMSSRSRGEDRALIVIESPARDEGTATLRRDRSLWNYLPRISRTMRVPPSMMHSSWMGSDLTNDDLTRSSTFRDDYTGTLVGRSESPAGWLARYDAHDDAVGLWLRVEYVVNDDGTLPLEARFYDRRSELARVMRFTEVREMDGRRIPTVTTIEPVDREGHRTEMRYLSIDFDADVPESTFSLTALERGR
jgi:Outer membrane lipoprotein-sorting protein